MSTLADAIAAVLVGAVFYLAGICVILIAGLVMHSAFFPHPEQLMIWAMVAWSLWFIWFSIRAAQRVLRRS